MYSSLLLLTALLPLVVNCSDETIDDNMLLHELVEYYGYPYENHTVITDDGYYLTIGRIPFELNKRDCTRKRGTIIAVHGIHINGEIFVFLGPQKSLGFLLADRCYDVWFQNTRGTKYSLGHKNLTADSREFWNFSFDETGRYDCRALIDYVVNVTGDTKINYIGFSQGSTQLMVLMTQKPEYQKYIHSAHFIAPIAALTHVNAYPNWLPREIIHTVTKFAPDLISRPFPDDDNIVQRAGYEACSNNSSVCGKLVDITLHPLLERHDLWKKYSARFPDRISLKLLGHMAQTHISHRFAMYDYGPKRNLELYGSEQSPLYDLHLIKVPVHLYHALNDIWSVPKDVDVIAGSLPNLRLNHFITEPNFDHADFLGSHKNMTKIVYNALFEALNHYT